MSRFNECAEAVAELVRKYGDNNGQRWHIPALTIVPVLEAHLGSPEVSKAPPKPVKKKTAAKPAMLSGTDSDDS